MFLLEVFILEHEYLKYCDPKYIDFDLMDDKLIDDVEKWYSLNKEKVDEFYREKYRRINE